MAQNVATAPSASQPAHETEQHTGNRLGPFLCWAVVFADIGTSVYYTPGILYSQPGIGRLAGLFVVMTLVVFGLLTLKYAEVSVRFPEGGGVVTVSARGLNMWAGAVGGMFILVDYFLTSAISSLSGVQYFSDLVPGIGPYELPITVCVVILLGALNWYGIRESATVSAVIAVAAVLIDAVILLVVLIHVPLGTIVGVFHDMFSGHALTPGVVVTGYAGAFLAFSGLESISQLSPVMRRPRSRTVTVALGLVAITVGITSPLLTIFSTTLLDAAKVDPNKFISELGGAYGGSALRVATALTAAALLVFASNTAIIGAYHVFLALSRMHFFPRIVEKTNKLRGTPHVSIALATGIPLLVLLAVGGRIAILGDMYAFGLLGAFSLTCIALDALRLRERQRGLVFDPHEFEANEPTDAPPAGAGNRLLSRVGARVLPAGLRGMGGMRGIGRARGALRPRLAGYTAIGHRVWPRVKLYVGFVTTALVAAAWCINLYSKPLATAFGGSLTVVGVAISIYTYRRSPIVLPHRRAYAMPGSVLVLLPSGAPENKLVIRSAIAGAAGRPVVFVGIGQQPGLSLRPMEIREPYLHDHAMQTTFNSALRLAHEAGVDAHFIYRTVPPGALPALINAAWRVVRPDELVAVADVAKVALAELAPEYVRYSMVSGVRIGHHFRHHRGAADTSSSVAFRAPGQAPTGTPTGTPTGAPGSADGGASDATAPEAGFRKKVRDAAHGFSETREAAGLSGPAGGPAGARPPTPGAANGHLRPGAAAPDGARDDEE